MSKVRLALAVPLYGDNEVTGLTRSFASDIHFLSGVSFQGAPLGGVGVICDETHWDSADVELDPSYQPKSIEHARNNLLKMFLEHPRQYTHLWLRDADSKAASPKVCAQVLGRMLKADRPLIGAAAVQKMHFWKQSAERTLEHLKAHPTATVDELADVIRGFAVRYVPDPASYPPFAEPDEHGLIPFDEPSFHFALLRRDCVEKMMKHYGDDPRLVYNWRRHALADKPAYDERHVGLFHTRITDGRFEAEDTSFVRRWKEIGGRCYLYVGEGTPIEHVGLTAFKGTRAAMLADWRGR